MRLEGGYRFGTPYGGITPYAAIQAQSFHTPGYAESGLIPNGFALIFNDRIPDSPTRACACARESPGISTC